MANRNILRPNIENAVKQIKADRIAEVLYGKIHLDKVPAIMNFY